MSATTPNLGLVLYDSSTDQAVLFATFRAVWGGIATTSNFYKIDTAYGAQQTAISNLQLTRGAITVAATYVSGSDYVATGISTISAYTTNMTILLKLNTTSNGTVTLNINSLGVKSVMKINSSGTAVNITGAELMANKYYLFTYDGTRWVWVDANSSDQIYIVGGTSGNVLTVNTDGTILGTTTPSLLISGTTHAESSKSSMDESDEIGIIDSAASYVLKKISWLNLKLSLWKTNNLPEGTVWNGKIETSVSSNNITVSIKTLSGSDPSSSSPVYVRIGNVVREITSSLSVTKNSGTNWFNAGSSELTDNEIDYFVYLGYNSTDGVTIGFARIPSALKYGDFSTTSTNARYCAINTITNAVSSDIYVNIGRINATLNSSYQWSIPATSIIVNKPIMYTRYLTWNPTYAGGITVSGGTTSSRYMIRDNNCICENTLEATTVSGTGVNITISVPIASGDGAIHLGTGRMIFSATYASAVVYLSTSGLVNMLRYDGATISTGSGNRYFGFFIEYKV